MISQTSLPSHRYKIAFFVNSMTCGGAERVALTLAKAMSSMNNDIFLILASHTGDFIKQIPPEINVINLNCKKPIKGIFSLAKKIKEIKPDAVICFGIYTGIAASISKTITLWKSPIIIRNESNIEYEWQTEDRLHNRVIGPILSKWAARLSKIVVVSQALKKPSGKFLHIKEKKITVIINPVEPNTEDLKKSLQQCDPWLSEKACPTFIAMGRLEYQKGFDTLLDAFQLASQKSQCRLIIFGEGSLRTELEKKIQQLNLADIVKMPGVTDHPLSQMKEASAFILPSRYEGFGLVLVEALCAGAHIIATDCNYGPAEILGNGHYGMLVPTEDSTAMANAIIQFTKKPATTRKPENKWFEQFSPINAAKKHIELIKKK